MRNRFFLLLLILLHCDSFSQSQLHSAENRAKFASYLIAEGDYLRASEEYDKLFSLTSDPVYTIKSASSLIRLGNYLQAAEKAETLYSEVYNAEANILLIIARLYLEEEQNVYPIPEVNNEYAGNIELLKLYDKARRSGFKTNETGALLSSPLLTQDARADISARYSGLRQISPALAALLSALVPGSGKIYTGDYSDGITALLTTSLFAYLTVINFKAGHDIRGYIFGAAALGFYAGNVYGSYAAARHRNLEVIYNFSLEIDGVFRTNSYFLKGKALDIYAD